MPKISKEKNKAKLQNHYLKKLRQIKKQKKMKKNRPKRLLLELLKKPVHKKILRIPKTLKR